MGENLKMGPGAYKKLKKWDLKSVGPPLSPLLRGDSLGIFGFECGAKWKIHSWKTLQSDQTSSEFDQIATDKTLRLWFLS